MPVLQKAKTAHSPMQVNMACVIHGTFVGQTTQCWSPSSISSRLPGLYPGGPSIDHNHLVVVVVNHDHRLKPRGSNPAAPSTGLPRSPAAATTAAAAASTPASVAATAPTAAAVAAAAIAVAVVVVVVAAATVAATAVATAATPTPTAPAISAAVVAAIVVSVAVGVAAPPQLARYELCRSRVERRQRQVGAPGGWRR